MKMLWNYIRTKGIKHAILLSTLVLSLSISGFVAYAQPGYGYEVVANGKQIGFVRDKDEMEQLLAENMESVRNFYGSDVMYDLQVDYTRGKVTPDMLTSVQSLKDNLTATLQLEKKAYLIKEGSRVVMTVDNEQTAQQVLDAVQGRYRNSHPDAKIDFVEEVTVIPVERMELANINNSSQAMALVQSPMKVASISRSNLSRVVPETVEESSFSLINVRSVYHQQGTISIAPGEQKVADPNLLVGKTVIRSNGTPGTKMVDRVVTEINGSIVSQVVSSEKLLTAPQPKIIAYGTKQPRPRVLDIAYQFQGVPYVWGGTTPRGFDCSGFTQYVFRKAGVYLPRTSYEQRFSGTAVSASNMKPGDLLAFPGHVGIYIGNGQMIHAPKPGDRVKIAPISGRKILSIRRLL